MIDFACKNFELEEVLKCALGLTRSGMQVFQEFYKNDDWMTTEQIAEKLGLEQSTVQRAVKELHEKDVLSRYQENLSAGGYMYTYKMKDKGHVKQVVMDTIKNWVEKVEEEMEKA